MEKSFGFLIASIFDRTRQPISSSLEAEEAVLGTSPSLRRLFRFHKGFIYGDLQISKEVQKY